MRARTSGPAALLLTITLLGSACGAVPQASSPSADGPLELASQPALEAVDVVGPWDIVSFEAYRPKRLNGTTRAAFADFGKGGVALRIECNHSGRAGKVEGGQFVPAADDGMQTVMSCGPERNARESRFFVFFSKASSIERAGPDRIRLRADGVELVLERPARRRLSNVPTPAEMQGHWRMIDLTRYLPGGGYTGGGLSEVPGRIVIGDGRISYNRCPQYAAAFRIDEGGKLTKAGGELPAAPRDCQELSARAGAPMQPALSDILRLLHSSPRIERSDGDSLLLSTDEFGLLITKAPCRSLDQSADHSSSVISDCASPA